MTASTALQEVAGGRQAAAIVPWYFTACFAADDDKHHVPSRGDSQRQRYGVRVSGVLFGHALTSNS
jgi:hypothetical protein